MLAEITCARCGTVFSAQTFPSKPRRYCSRRCWLKVHNNPERNAIVARATIEQRADKLRDRGDGKTYRKRAGRHEHRVIAEQLFGRKLTADDIVHHKDGDRRNNDPGNLELTNRVEHARHHLAEWWGRPVSPESRAKISATKRRQAAAKGGDAKPVS